MTDITRDELVALLAEHSTREVMRQLGLSTNSYTSLRTLCERLGVEIPKRANQHAPREPESGVQTRSRRGLGVPAQRREIGVERAVVLGDLHIPFHDPRAIAIALEMVKDIQPEVVYLNGDILDCYAVSRFDKDPSRALQLQDEIDQTTEFLTRLREAVPHARIVYVRGNHEARIGAYLNSRAPELQGLRALDIRSLLHLDDLDIEWVAGRGKEAYTTYGAVKVGHFDRVAPHAGYAAKLLLDKHAHSLVQGHTHRLADVYRRYPGGHEVVGVEGGCLCDLNPEYVSDPQWTHGLVVITKELNGNRFHVQPVAITGYRALYNDVLYEA